MLDQNKVIFETFEIIMNIHLSFLEKIKEIYRQNEILKIRPLDHFSDFALLSISGDSAFEKYKQQILAEIELFKEVPLNESTLLEILNLRKKILEDSIGGLQISNLGTGLNVARHFYHDLYIDFYKWQEEGTLPLREFWMDN